MLAAVLALALLSADTGPPVLDHDDFGLNQSKIIREASDISEVSNNVIDSNSLERDAGGKPRRSFPHPALGGAPAFAILAESAVHVQTLREKLVAPLMDKFHDMNAAKQGIFQEDISAIVGAYFPPGQSFVETQRIIREQNLGSLMLFKGMQDSPGTMYVSRFDLMNGMFSEVYVVLNFDFAGKTETDMTVTKAGGYLRGGGM